MALDRIIIFIYLRTNEHMIKLYNNLLEMYAIPTKCLTSGTLFSLGDLISQKGTSPLT